MGLPKEAAMFASLKASATVCGANKKITAVVLKKSQISIVCLLNKSGIANTSTLYSCLCMSCVYPCAPVTM